MNIVDIPSHVYVVGTYFAAILHSKAVKLIQPIWNWLTIPAEGKFQGIVDPLLFLLFTRSIARCIGGSWRRLHLLK
jgi:hypothetical protein